METMALIKKDTVFAALLMLPGIAMSESAIADVSFYAGAEAGYADVELDEFKDSTNYQVFAGIRVIDVVGLELGYGALGDFETEVGGRSSIEVDSVVQVSIAFHGPLLVLEKGRVHARYGYYRADVTPTFNGSTLAATTAEDFTYSLGLSYPVYKALSAGFNWQFYNEMEGQTINTYSAGLRLDF